MLVNSCITVFHKGIDETTRLEKWTRFNYGTKTKNTVWAHGGIIAKENKGYSDASSIKIRIPYELNENLNVNNFALEDMIVIDEITTDITSQNDLKDYEVFKIISITDERNGNNQHIYIGAD